MMRSLSALSSTLARLGVALLVYRLAIAGGQNTALNQRLLDACETGRADAVRKLLAEGADVNARSKYKSTPLIKAAHNGHVEILKLLLQKGADIDATDDERASALQWAVVGSPTEDPADKLATAKLLIAHGANVNTADTNGQTPLMEAAARGDADIVRLLLENGAEIDAQNRRGATALMQTDEPAVLQVLLQHGAKVEARDQKGQTPLLHAAKQTCLECIKVLVDHGADVHARDERGRNALHWYMIENNGDYSKKFEGDTETVAYLLDHGVDPNEKDADGRTVLQEAILHKRTAVIELLRQHGAR